MTLISCSKDENKINVIIGKWNLLSFNDEKTGDIAWTFI